MARPGGSRRPEVSGGGGGAGGAGGAQRGVCAAPREAVAAQAGGIQVTSAARRRLAVRDAVSAAPGRAARGRRAAPLRR